MADPFLPAGAGASGPPVFGWLGVAAVLGLLGGVLLLVVYLAYYCGPAGEGGLDGLSQIRYVSFFGN